LEKLAAGKTVVAIAHRLSTVLSSDMIVVMDQGQVAATGSHDELLAKSDIYRTLYEIQFGRAETVVAIT
jgi:ABC-type multidrug transport system fused ATPase/permease subunit